MKLLIHRVMQLFDQLWKDQMKSNLQVIVAQSTSQLARPFHLCHNTISVTRCYITYS